jgi:hypothetical protein
VRGAARAQYPFSRISDREGTMVRIWIGIALAFVTGTCFAQGAGLGTSSAASPVSQSTDPDVRSKKLDPGAVYVPLYAGAPVRDVLKALTDKGFTIKWDESQVPPTMTLLERPKATRIDRLLNEILAPYNLRADHNLMDGGYRVRPQKKPKN